MNHPQTKKSIEAFRRGELSEAEVSELCQFLVAHLDNAEEKVKASQRDFVSILGLVADIRKAVGDGEGKLMQPDLVKHCGFLAGGERVWRKESSAPKDGSIFLADVGEEVAAVMFWSGSEWVAANNNTESENSCRTFAPGGASPIKRWKPLPKTGTC